MTVLAVPGVAYAEANWGRWIARCPYPGCASALAIAPGTEEFECWDCGYVAESVAWPPDVEAIEALLSMRPVKQTRSWLPGETLIQLLEENLAHGIVPQQWREIADTLGGATPLLTAVGERVTGGLLMDLLPAARRLEIAA